MIDHLRRYDNEAEALADQLVAAYRTEDGWDTSRVIPGCQVYTITDATTDGEGNEVETREYLPYWYLWVAEREVVEALRGQCIVIADREAAARGEPFIVETMMQPEQLPLYRIEPVIAGSVYPFGVALHPES